MNGCFLYPYKFDVNDLIPKSLLVTKNIIHLIVIMLKVILRSTLLIGDLSKNLRWSIISCSRFIVLVTVRLFIVNTIRIISVCITLASSGNATAIFPKSARTSIKCQTFSATTKGIMKIIELVVNAKKIPRKMSRKFLSRKLSKLCAFSKRRNGLNAPRIRIFLNSDMISNVVHDGSLG